MRQRTLKENWVYQSKDLMLRFGNDVFKICWNPILHGEVLTGDPKDKYYGVKGKWKCLEEKGSPGKGNKKEQLGK